MNPPPRLWGEKNAFQFSLNWVGKRRKRGVNLRSLGRRRRRPPLRRRGRRGGGGVSSSLSFTDFVFFAQVRETFSLAKRSTSCPLELRWESENELAFTSPHPSSPPPPTHPTWDSRFFTTSVPLPPPPCPFPFPPAHMCMHALACVVRPRRSIFQDFSSLLLLLLFSPSRRRSSIREYFHRLFPSQRRKRDTHGRKSERAE